jgi:hypothetical protein
MRRVRCHRKHVVEHGSLLSNIARFTQCMAKGPVQIEEAWRASCDRYFFHQSQSDCSHASCFDFSSEQSDGPRANRSSRYQESQISPRLANSLRDFFDRRHKTLGTAHQTETVMTVSQTANHLLGFKFT